MYDEEIAYWNGMCKGDERAFDKLYHCLAPDLFRYGYRICSDPETVQDGVQDVFLKIWHSHLELINVASPRFYLYKSLRNRLIRGIEYSKRVSNLDDLSIDELFADEEHIEKTWICEEDLAIQSKKLKDALEKLSARQLEVIQLRYYHDFSAEEVGKIMSINPQSVRNLQNRAMQQLRSELPSITASLLSFMIFGKY